ncbi:MAG TPA: AtpZ/AtpI family protein [Terriglobales bacterium]|nr:AtpZ/AtpI family protein [Terriglobales bacterium]
MAERDDDNRNEPRTSSLIGKAFELGMITAASIIVGLLAGAALDRWLHTQWITLVGVLVGVVAGFIEMIRRALAMSK